MLTLALLQDADSIEVGPIGLWWLWLLVAIVFLGTIIYLVKRIGPWGGPWMR